MKKAFIPVRNTTGTNGVDIRPGCPVPVWQPRRMALKNRDEKGVCVLVTSSSIIFILHACAMHT